MLARSEDSVLVVVDVQPGVFNLVHERERVLSRTAFIVRCARALDVPVLVTEQNPGKLSPTEPALAEVVWAQAPGRTPKPAIAKMSFSCAGEPAFVEALHKLNRSQAVLVGIETHICVCQTAHDLMDDDLDVLVCADAVGARSHDAHESGLRRMADDGAAVAHTESVVYEWMRSAEHPAFREVLQFVKG